MQKRIHGFIENVFQKTWIEFFAASKDKKHEFNFCQTSKTQKNTDLIFFKL